ncbi:hypothetical protein AUP45_21965 [Thalassospira xiamenensis]|nr:hypothetical protein AUP45_21965 [Thalassospira xiamenensis]
MPWTDSWTCIAVHILELTFHILDTDRITRKQVGRADNKLCFSRQSYEPGRHLTIEIDTLFMAQRQIMREAVEGQRTQPSQMDLMLHDRLDRQQNELPIGSGIPVQTG